MRITGTSHDTTFTFKSLLRMRYVSDKSCRENQNIHFIFNNCFLKVVPFMRYCRKIWWSQRSHKWRHNMAHTRCMLDKQGYMHACAYTQINVYYLLLFHSNNDSRALLNVILYVYCLSCYLHKWRQNRDDAPGCRVSETRFYCHTTTVLLSLFFFISYVVPSSVKSKRQYFASHGDLFL